MDNIASRCYDIISDCLLTGEYFTKTYFDISVSNISDSSVSNITNDFLGLVPNITSRQCVPDSITGNSTEGSMYVFSCWEYDPFFGIMTLSFILLPTPYILSSIIGTIAGGYYGTVWGGLMGLSGYYLSDQDDRTGGILTLFLLLFGFGLVIIGLIRTAAGFRKRDNSTESKKDFYKRRFSQIKNVWHIFFIYPFLIPFAPFIFLVINLQALIRPDNDFIKEQAKLSCLGESILEAAPQFCLQLYVVLSTWNASWSQLSSITTSVLTLSLANLDKFLVQNRNIELGLNIDSAKYFPIMFLNSTFRIMTISLVAIIFQTNSIYVIAVGWSMEIIISLIFFKCAVSFDKMEKEKEWQSQYIESMLSFYTMTNLDNTKSARFFRKLSTFYYVIFYSLTLGSMALIQFFAETLEKDYPELVDRINGKIPHQSIFLSATGGIGLLGLVIDWIYARVGWGAVFHIKSSHSRSHQARVEENNESSESCQLQVRHSPHRPLFWLFWAILQKLVFNQNRIQDDL